MQKRSLLLWICAAALAACVASPDHEAEQAPWLSVAAPTDAFSAVDRVAARVKGCSLAAADNGRSVALLANGQIEVGFDVDTGQVVRVVDARRSPPLELMDGTALAPVVPPYELQEISALWGSGFYVTRKLAAPTPLPQITCDGDSLTLDWQLPAAWPSVGAVWTLTADAPEVRVTAEVRNLGGRMIHGLRYPILAGLLSLVGEGANDALVLPHEGGLRIAAPFARLREEIYSRGDFLERQRYPKGHAMMAQMEAYLHEGTGGVLLYTADPNFAAKEFGFAARETGGDPAYTAAWQLYHYNADVTNMAGTGLFTVDYPTVLRWLDRGDWEEAAGVYREWSDQQVWASEPLATREPEERAFFERLGASVFGISGRIDQRPWIAAFRHELVEGIPGAELLYVLGWDFHPLGSPDDKFFMAMQQGGWDEVFWRPFAGKTMDNIDQIRAQSDRVALFYYDLLIDSVTPGWDGLPPLVTPEAPNTEDWSSHLLIGERGGAAGFHYWDNVDDGLIYTLDPADPFVIDFWRWRDALVTAETDPPIDALYFDLGFAVVIDGSYPALAQSNPTHPSGAGRWLVQAARDALDYPRGAPNPRGFRYGAENATEPFADLVDFYHLGAAGDGPMRNKLANSDPPAFAGVDQWIMNGAAIPIPLLSYLQHHLGNLRTGGKTQISEEVGDVFYWIVAAEYVWGGVVELIYFNTPVDWLPSLTPELACRGYFDRCAFQTDWGNTQVGGDRRGWSVNGQVREADPDKLAYLRSAIELRVASAATPYLTLGRMEPAPALQPAPAAVDFSYSHYASINGPEYHHSGVWRAPPVRVAAWRHPADGSVALLVANAASETIVTNLVVDPDLYGLAGAAMAETKLALRTAPHRPPAAPARRVGGRYVVPLNLPPHAFRMFTLTR